nr:MAG TPA: hypothetical protein [Bacteriophage sp.]
MSIRIGFFYPFSKLRRTRNSSYCFSVRVPCVAITI